MSSDAILSRSIGYRRALRTYQKGLKAKWEEEAAARQQTDNPPPPPLSDHTLVPTSQPGDDSFRDDVVCVWYHRLSSCFWCFDFATVPHPANNPFSVRVGHPQRATLIRRAKDLGLFISDFADAQLQAAAAAHGVPREVKVEFVIRTLAVAPGARHFLRPLTNRDELNGSASNVKLLTALMKLIQFDRYDQDHDEWSSDQEKVDAARRFPLDQRGFPTTREGLVDYIVFVAGRRLARLGRVSVDAPPAAASTCGPSAAADTTTSSRPRAGTPAPPPSALPDDPETELNKICNLMSQLPTA